MIKEKVKCINPGYLKWVLKPIGSAPKKYIFRDPESPQLQIDYKKKEKILSSNIPPNFRSKSFQNYEIYDPKQGPAKLYLKEWQDNINKKRNIIFAGNIGNGKTHLACATIKAIKYEGLYYKFRDLMDILIKLKITDLYRFENLMSRIINCKFLILDEISKNSDTKYTKQILHKIVDERLMLKSTIYISDKKYNEFATYIKSMDPSIYSRMFYRKSAIYPFKWDDYRQRIL